MFHKNGPIFVHRLAARPLMATTQMAARPLMAGHIESKKIYRNLGNAMKVLRCRETILEYENHKENHRKL